jgi:hypothetical protein
VKQWAKVETLVKLGFRFETIYDNEGAAVRYPATERGIPTFVERLAQLRAAEEVTRASKGRRTQARRKQRARRASRSKKA